MQIRLFVLSLLVFVTSVTSAQSFGLLSIKGNRQTCTNNASQCVVIVSVWKNTAVPGGCEAAVYMQRVAVKAAIPVTWQIVKTDMTDTNVYEFVDTGIQWVPNPDNKFEVDADKDAAKSFDPPSSSSGTTTQWMAKNLVDPGPQHAYRPQVRIRSGLVNCKAGDPKISNDGN